jgi:hypothetical protein
MNAGEVGYAHVEPPASIHLVPTDASVPMDLVAMDKLASKLMNVLKEQMNAAMAV